MSSMIGIRWVLIYIPANHEIGFYQTCIDCFQARSRKKEGGGEYGHALSLSLS